MPSARRSFYLASAWLPLILCLAITTLAQEAQRNEPRQPKIIRHSGVELQRKATRFVEPIYPLQAKAALVSGQVDVEVTVDEDGKVVSARPISGNPLLDDSAITAARGWIFEPTTVEGIPVKAIGTITLYFRLSGSELIQQLELRLRANPGSAETHLSLAEAYQRESRLDEAIAEYTQAITLKPDYATAFFGLGHTYDRKRLDDSARDAYRQAIKFNRGLDPDGSPKDTLRHDQYVFISEFYYRHAEYQESIEVLKQAASHLGDIDDIRILDDICVRLGLIYLEIGDKQSALNEHTALKDKKAEWAQKLLESIEHKN